MAMADLEEQTTQSSSFSSSSATSNRSYIRAFKPCSEEKFRCSDDSATEGKEKQVGRMDNGSEDSHCLDSYSYKEGKGEDCEVMAPTANHFAGCVFEEVDQKKDVHKEDLERESDKKLLKIRLNNSNSYDQGLTLKGSFHMPPPTLIIPARESNGAEEEQMSSTCPGKPDAANVTDSMQSSCATVSSGIFLTHFIKSEIVRSKNCRNLERHMK
jgi:hypothetical protein